jgi:hypothetical protein
VNGTTFVVHPNVIFAAVITGGNKSEYLSIPCIKLEPSESRLPFTVRRRQFSAIWAFAITITKSSRQSFGCVGVYLLDFLCHSLLFYYLLAQGRTQENVKVCHHYIHTIEEKFCLMDCTSTQNVT